MSLHPNRNMEISPKHYNTWTINPESDSDGFFETPSPQIRPSPSADLPIVLRPKWPPPPKRISSCNVASIAFSAVIHSVIRTCQPPSFPSSNSSFLSPSSRRRRRLIGTIFGPRRGRVTFAIQDDHASPPGFLLELAFQTAHLVHEMASGTVRILLECEKQHLSSTPESVLAGGSKRCPLWDEPLWTVYCNGRRSGFAVSRKLGENDKHVFQTVGTVSAGAGVLPPMSTPVECHNRDDSTEMMFMRAEFERVVGSKDSEAFYMMSPDGGGSGECGPELSIFLLRV